MIQPRDRVRVIAPGGFQGMPGTVIKIGYALPDILDPVRPIPMFPDTETDPTLYAVVKTRRAIHTFPISMLALQHTDQTAEIAAELWPETREGGD